MLKRSLTVAVGALAVVGLIATGFTSAYSADDPIAKRKELMKGVGGSAKTIGGMMEAGFDAAKAAEAANVIVAAAKEFPGLLPDGSQTGGETTASPKIWEEMDKFKMAMAALETDAMATATAAAAGEAQFKEAAGKMFGNCKSCHEAYRIMK